MGGGDAVTVRAREIQTFSKSEGFSLKSLMVQSHVAIFDFILLFSISQHWVTVKACFSFPVFMGQLSCK